MATKEPEHKTAFLGLALLLLAFTGRAASPPKKLPSERRVEFNGGWRFFKGEIEKAQDPEFNDSLWRQVQLPHDWAIEGPFDSRLNPHTGALPAFGEAWYRKSFLIP